MAKQHTLGIKTSMNDLIPGKFDPKNETYSNAMNLALRADQVR